MGIADSMKETTENIIASYDLRVKELDDLIADTRKTLRGFTSDRKKMAGEQGEGLADFVKDLSNSVGGMLKGFKRNQKEVSEEQAKRLSTFITALSKEVGLILKGFEKARSEMSEELKERLVKEVMAIKNETDKLLAGYNSDMKKAANAWQGMSKTLARARNGSGIMPKAKADVRPIAGVKKFLKESVKEVEEGEAPPEIEFEGKMIEFIERHPKGVKVGNMEKPFGLPRTRLGVMAKRLLEEGKVRKEGNLYLPR